MDLGGISSNIMGYLSSAFIWGGVILVILICAFGYVIVRKKNKLNTNVLEVVYLGNGKVEFYPTTGGWFATKWILNLWDYGPNREFKIKDGRKVNSLSTEDYHTYRGKRCVVCARKPDDPKILIPVSKLIIDNKSMESIMSVAPADFTEASLAHINSAQNETMGKLEKLIPWIALGLVAIIVLIAIVITTQYASGALKESKDLWLKTMDASKANLANQVATQQASQGVTAP